MEKSKYSKWWNSTKCGISVNTMSQVTGLTTEESRFDFSYVCAILFSPKCPERQWGLPNFMLNAYWRFVCSAAKLVEARI